MLNQPKIQPSSDAEWKAYYERKGRIAEKREKAMRQAIDQALTLMSEPDWEGMAQAVMVLELAIRHPILRRAPVEGGGVVYTDDEPITE